MEPNGGDPDEVHRGDAVPVIEKKRLPSLPLIVVGISLREISRDGGKADPKAELLEFRLDLSGSPTVLIGESTNEGLYLDGDRRSSRTGPRNESPVQPESLAVPADDCVRLDDDQGLPPSRPDPRQQYPETSIGWIDPGAAALLGESCELLTQSEFDDRLLASASKESRDAAKGDRREFEQLPHCRTHSV
ncbi:MAG: hypothetical protein JRF61_14950 [Deltaproteobacteria bacterium]|nr:hypothetical protein [Deltaproteobacteria bacterium]